MSDPIPTPNPPTGYEKKAGSNSSAMAAAWCGLIGVVATCIGGLIVAATLLGRVGFGAMLMVFGLAAIIAAIRADSNNKRGAR